VRGLSTLDYRARTVARGSLLLISRTILHSWSREERRKIVIKKNRRERLLAGWRMVDV